MLRRIPARKRSVLPVNTRDRRGATLVEGAIVLSTLLVIVLGSLDLSLAVWQYNTLAQAARQGAREAAVHGAQAAPVRIVWGPATRVVIANDGSDIALAVGPSLVGIAPDEVTITIEWPDGVNTFQSRVRCTITTEYEPVVASLFADSPWTLTATSNMAIDH
jgi:Flp pilus assembly protein TadG